MLPGKAGLVSFIREVAIEAKVRLTERKSSSIRGVLFICAPAKLKDKWRIFTVDMKLYEF